MVETPDGQYVVLQHIALLDEHDLPAEGGQPAVSVGPSELAEIARNGNERVRQTGDATPIIVGHTKDNSPEVNYPVVGFARNFTIGKLDNSERNAVFADLYVRKDREGVIHDFPRRSVELWVNRLQIDPICFLGGTSPERDLGLADPTVLRYSRKNKGERIVRYSMPEEGDRMPATMPTEMPKPAMKEADEDMGGAADQKIGDMTVQELSAALMKTQDFAPLAELAQMLQEQEDAPEAQEGQLGDETPSSAPIGAKATQGASEARESRIMHEKPPVKYAAMDNDRMNDEDEERDPVQDYSASTGGSSAATMTNTRIPREYSRPVAPPPPTHTNGTGGITAKQADDLHKRIKALEEQLQGQTQLARYSMRRQQLKDIRENEFVKMSDDDIEQELKDFGETPDPTWTAHLTRVRKYEKAKPEAEDFRRFGGGPPPPKGQTTDAERGEIVRYAAANGIGDYDEAKRRYAKAKAEASV